MWWSIKQINIERKRCLMDGWMDFGTLRDEGS